MQVVEYFEKGNDVILDGPVITEYAKIIEEIKNQFDYSDIHSEIIRFRSMKIS